MFDFLIQGGTVVSPEGSHLMNIGIADGKVCELLSPHLVPPAKNIIQAEGMFIIPGLIDVHVQFNDPGTTFREDFEHATAACAVGGITTAIAMPTNMPLVLTPNSFQRTLDAYSHRGYVDYAIHGGLDPSNLERLEDLWLHSGVTAIKAFTCYSSPDMGWVRDDILLPAMKIIAKHHGTMIIHAENHELISLYERNLRQKSIPDGLAHCQSHPALSEIETVQRIILYSEQTGATVVFPHVSTWESLTLIHQAREKGIPVYAEMCPQYLIFTEKDVQKQGPYLKFTPPVHDETNRQHLLQLLKCGYVHTIGSDHSPYTCEEKERGRNRIWDAPNGIPGLEVLLPNMLNLVNQGYLSLEQLVQITSATPSLLYHLPRKGRLLPGYDADLVIIDLNKEQIYTEEMIQSKNKWSPYLGKQLKGWPVLTMVRGHIVARDFHLTGQKGHGIYIPRPK